MVLVEKVQFCTGLNTLFNFFFFVCLFCGLALTFACMMMMRRRRMIRRKKRKKRRRRKMRYKILMIMVRFITYPKTFLLLFTALCVVYFQQNI